MYSDTVTIFNRSGTENNGYMWFPTVLSNVDLIIDKGANIQKMGTDKADTAKLHVKYRMSGQDIAIDGKVYLPPKRWLAQSDDLKSTTLTFRDGVDFFISGEYTEEPVSDDEFISGTKINGFFDHLNKEKDFVFTITNVGGPYKLIQHFEIGGA